MKITARKTIVDKNGYRVFTEGHTYDVYMDKGNILAVYSDLNAMYNLKKDNLEDFILE